MHLIDELGLADSTVFNQNLRPPGPERRLLSPSLNTTLNNFQNEIWGRKSHLGHHESNNRGTRSTTSLHRVEALDMEIRRTNPGMIGKAKLNTIKITVALVGAFLACWTPYYVMCLW
jgi:hypothetical protein